MSQNTISPKRASSDPMRYCRTVSPAENSEPTTVPASTSSSVGLPLNARLEKYVAATASIAPTNASAMTRYCPP